MRRERFVRLEGGVRYRPRIAPKMRLFAAGSAALRTRSVRKTSLALFRPRFAPKASTFAARFAAQAMKNVRMTSLALFGLRFAPKGSIFAARLVAQAMKSVLLKALAKLQKVAHRRYAATDFQASSMREFAAVLVVVRAVALAVLKDRVVGIIAVSALSKIRADSAVMWARRRALLLSLIHI